MRGRPRKGTSVHFEPTDGIAPVQERDTVLGLRFNIEARYGGVVEIDLVDVHPRQIVIAFAGALRRQSELGGSLGARSTIKQHLQGYLKFFAFLRKHTIIKTLQDLRAEDIEGYETFLKSGGMKPIHLHSVLAKVILALRSIDADHPGLLAEGVRRRLNYTSAHPIGRSQPRDAYSPFVARQLRDAARADITNIFKRVGKPFDEDDDYPYLREITDEANARIAAAGRISSGDRIFKKVYFMRLRRGLSVSTLAEDLHARFHLRAFDIPPLISFLSLETGLEIECCKTLTIECLQNPRPGTVEIAYVKRRARGSEYKNIRVRDGGIGTPGGLIRKLIEVTAFTRQFVPSDCLWLYYYTGRKQLRAGIAYPHELVDRWTRSHNILNDNGEPLRLVLSRLRKTHKALWYLKTEGHMARFAVGHTSEIAARHYADIPSLRPLHEATVAEAFTEAAAVLGPTILASGNEDSWRKNHSASEGGTNVDTLLNGEQDVWLAACSGFTSSPFGKQGAPCPQPFWGCLECSNAVITERKLPAIIAFLQFIEDQRIGLAAMDWAMKFGRVHDRIVKQILSAFPESVIAIARLEAERSALYLPPEARQ